MILDLQTPPSQVLNEARLLFSKERLPPKDCLAAQVACVILLIFESFNIIG